MSEEARKPGSGSKKVSRGPEWDVTMPMTQNLDGRWVPDIPLPLFSKPRNKCMCGRKFWTLLGYRGHYALVHILRLET